MAKKKYYNISNILKTDAPWMMLLGQRSNGKSYQVKQTALENAYKNNMKFIYLRRWKEDVRQKAVTSYFEDMNIEKITNKEYNCITTYNGSMYFAKKDSEDKVVSKKEIGRYCSLNEAERYKSQVFKDYKYIIYEEFITDSVYLANEPTILQQFVSTVARDKKVTVFLVGNTLSRVCPYFNEWCLDGVLRQKIGTIEIYHHHVKDKIIDIAVEYCGEVDINNTMFFGNTSKQIISGEWDTIDVPKLPRKQFEYDKVYEVLVEHQMFKFVLELLVEPLNGGLIVYIYPYTKKRRIDRIISTRFSDNPMISAKLDMNRKAEYLISECFKKGKVCYSDNMTVSDFKKVNEQFKIGSLVV